MRVFIGIDSFKGSLSSREIGETVASVFQKAQFATDVFAVADGGEGTIDAITCRLPHQLHKTKTLDLRHEPMLARLVECERYVLIEAAETIGMTRYVLDSRDVPRVSSYGVGVQLKAALAFGKPIVVALGGTGTTDGGLGMLQALGVRPLTKNQEIPIHSNPLLAFETLDWSGLDTRVHSNILIAIDVTNPLFGPEGAAHVFARQKGANEPQIDLLDEGLRRLATQLPRDVAHMPGSGAAGGIAAALLALGGEIVPGFDWLYRELRMEEALLRADWVITGEGQIDAQSFYGKTAVRLAERARAQGKPTIALAGSITVDLHEPFTAMFPIHQRPISLEEALRPETTREALVNTARSLAALLSRTSCDLSKNERDRE